MSKIVNFFRDETAATAIEYGLIAALIAVAIISGVGLLGNKVGKTFNTISNGMP